MESSRTGEIRESSQIVRSVTKKKLNLNVSDEKLKQVTKIYLQNKGMIVDANELDLSSSDSSCMGEDGHDPFKCRYGA